MKIAFPEIKKQVSERFKDNHSKQIFDIAARMQIPEERTLSVNCNGTDQNMDVTRTGMGPLQTPYGDIWLFNFNINDNWSKYSVLVKCPKINYDTLDPIFMHPEELLLRVDSGCETGHIFLDNTCDCPNQLHKAMEEVIYKGEGIIVSIPSQDGRGKGTPFKLATLFLQKELGLNTIQSAAYLADGEDIDIRTYHGVVGIMKYLGITPEQTTIYFATNSSHKRKALEENKFKIQNKPIEIEPTQHTALHLKAKKDHLNHALK